jgi:hypothetical protein
VNQHLEGETARQQRHHLLQKLYASLIALARRHAGYQTLFNICADLDEREHLVMLMVMYRSGLPVYVAPQLFRSWHVCVFVPA